MLQWLSLVMLLEWDYRPVQRSVQNLMHPMFGVWLQPTSLLE